MITSRRRRASAVRAARASAGFTLVELMVALLITAVMFAIGYTELNQALKSRRELDEQSARLLAVQTALRTIEQDIELLQPRPVRNVLGDGYLPAVTTTELAGNTMGSINSNSSNSSSAAPALVTLTRGGWTNPVGVQRSELQRVSYALQNGTLIRQYSPVLDATLEDSSVSRILLDHVQSFSLRFMDAGHNWQTQWPAPAVAGESQHAQLRSRPVAVEVSLQLDDWGLIVRDIEVAG